MQYLAWIRESSEHFAAGNLLSPAKPIRDFVHPGVLSSALLHRLGLSIPLSYAIWVPVATGTICAGAWMFMRDVLPRGWPRATGLALGLLYSAPTFLFLSWVSPSTSGLIRLVDGDASTLGALWGYPFSALPIGLTCLAVVHYSRLWGTGRRFSKGLVALALVISWLQPWQGVTTLVILGGAELLLLAPRFAGRFGPAGEQRHSRWLGLSAASAALIPLVYYALLGRFDQGFAESERNLSIVIGGERWWMMFIAVLPLLLPALLVLRVETRSVPSLTARIWAAAAIGQAVLLSVTGISSSPSHALRGAAIPLAALAVIGVQGVLKQRRTVLALTAIGGVLLCAVPGTVNNWASQRESLWGTGVDYKVAGYFITNQERDAINWIGSSPMPGGVLADRKMAPLVPWMTGRQVWAGHGNWTPQSLVRFGVLGNFFNGVPLFDPKLSTMSQGRFVQATGSRFVIVNCVFSPIASFLDAQLLQVASSKRSFGCVSVYVIKPAPKGQESRSDAGRLERSYGAGFQG